MSHTHVCVSVLCYGAPLLVATVAAQTARGVMMMIMMVMMIMVT
jgi:hypothetical protein